MGTDEGEHLSFMLAVSQAKGIKAAWFRLRFWLYIRWAYMWQFNRQDQQMIEQVSIPPERLFRPDKSIITWRAHLERSARGVQGTTGETVVHLGAGEGADEDVVRMGDLWDDSDAPVSGPG